MLQRGGLSAQKLYNVSIVGQVSGGIENRERERGRGKNNVRDFGMAVCELRSGCEECACAGGCAACPPPFSGQSLRP